MKSSKSPAKKGAHLDVKDHKDSKVKVIKSEIKPKRSSVSPGSKSNSSKSAKTKTNFID